MRRRNCALKYNPIYEEVELLGQKYKTKRIIEDILIKEGYEYFEPSNFDDIDRFLPLTNGMGQASIVKVIAGDSRILALNPDNTTSLISWIAPLWQDDVKLKLFYSSTAFRSDKEAGIIEIKQIGVERLGERDFQTDAEVLLLALDILNQFRSDFIMEISDSKYVNGLLEEIDLPLSVKRHLKGIIYRKDKKGLSDFIKTSALSEPVSKCLLNIFDLQGDAKDIVSKAKRVLLNQTMAESLQELDMLQNLLNTYGYLGRVSFDLSMITELDYYNGLTFKGYYPGYFKEALSGGRYDSFTEKYGKKIPAVGFSLDLDQMTKVSLDRSQKGCEPIGLPENSSG